MANAKEVANILRNDRNLQVGNVCVQWAHLEYLLALVIWSLLRVDSGTGKIVTGGLDIIPRVNMAIALAKHLEAPKIAIDALTDVRKAIQKDLIDRRNFAVHGHRLIDSTDPSADLVEVHRGKGDRKRRKLTNKDLAKLGKDINETANTFHDAMFKSGVYHAVCAKPAKIIPAK